MERDPHAFQIFVDGSCFVHEGRRSGYAGYVLHPDGSTEQIIFRGYQESTINRMELSAVVAALEWVREERPRVQRVQIFSDSQWVVDSILRAHYWQGNGWRNLDGRPIEHRDLWRKFLAARVKSGRRVDFGWARGKADAVRKTVDRGAKAAAKAGTRIDPGYIAGKIGRAKTKGGSASMFPAKAQAITIRVYGSRSVKGAGEQRIKFETYDETTQQCGTKHFAYAQPAIGNELHRQRVFRVRMNNNPKYPQILEVVEEIPFSTKKKRAGSAAITGAPAEKWV